MLELDEKNPMSLTPVVLQREFELPGHPRLKLRIYGLDKARELGEIMAQAVAILRDGVPTAPCDLEAGERAAVKSYLEAKHPEHATLY